MPHLIKCLILIAVVAVQCAVSQSLTANAGPAELKISTDGQPNAVIVTPDVPTPLEQLAAEEMAAGLRHMKSGEFQIIKESSLSDASRGQIVISIGKTTFANGITMQGEEWMRESREAFRMVRRDNALIICGNPDSEIADQGALWGVYAFLEMQGIGRYMYSPIGHVFPPKPTIAIGELDITDAPWFKMRGGSDTMSGSLARYLPGGDKADQPRPELEWFSRSSAARKVDYYHLWQYLITDDLRKAHPDWFKDTHNPKYGPHPSSDTPEETRTDAGVCLSHPGIRQLFIDHFRKRFQDDPELYGATICADDYLVGERCDCPDCQRLMNAASPPTITFRSPRNATDLYVDFVNAVAEALEPEFPGRKLVMYAYLDYMDPPKSVRVHKNVIIMFAPLDSPDELDPRLDRMVRGWREAGAQEIYWYGYLLSRPPVPHLMSQWFRNYKRLGIDGVYLEVTHKSAAFSALNSWLQFKLMWNPEADVNELVSQFCAGMYGPEIGPLMERLIFTWSSPTPFAKVDVPQLLAEIDRLAGPPGTELYQRVGLMTQAYRLYQSAYAMDAALKENNLPQALVAVEGGIAAGNWIVNAFPEWGLQVGVPLLNRTGLNEYQSAVLPGLKAAMNESEIQRTPEPPASGTVVCLTENADIAGNQRARAGATVAFSPKIAINPENKVLFDGELLGQDRSATLGGYGSWIIDIDLKKEYQIDHVEVCVGMNELPGNLTNIRSIPISADIAIGNDGANFTTIDRIFFRTLPGYSKSESLLRTTRFVRVVVNTTNMAFDVNEIRVWGRAAEPKKTQRAVRGR